MSLGVQSCTCTCVLSERPVLVFVVYEFHHFPSKFKIIIVVKYNVYLYLTMFMMIILELPQTAICLALSLALKSTNIPQHIFSHLSGCFILHLQLVCELRKALHYFRVLWVKRFVSLKVLCSRMHKSSWHSYWMDCMRYESF